MTGPEMAAQEPGAHKAQSLMTIHLTDAHKALTHISRGIGNTECLKADTLDSSIQKSIQKTGNTNLCSRLILGRIKHFSDAKIPKFYNPLKMALDSMMQENITSLLQPYLW